MLFYQENEWLIRKRFRGCTERSKKPGAAESNPQTSGSEAAEDVNESEEAAEPV